MDSRLIAKRIELSSSNTDFPKDGDMEFMGAAIPSRAPEKKG